MIKCVRGLMYALLACSCKFIVLSDMCHIGMDWDNMAYDKFVAQLRLIKAYR